MDRQTVEAGTRELTPNLKRTRTTTTQRTQQIAEGGQAHFAPKTAQNEPVPGGLVPVVRLG